ncbi:MAG: hypothetical protein QOF48_3458 [Verrucomicrobiota bacterium]|jgi:hypothetical protein
MIENQIKQPRLAVLACACLLLVGTAKLRSAEPAPSYEMGFRNITNIQGDLLAALDRRQRQLVGTSTKLLADVRMPCIASLPGADAKTAGGPVQLSSGFIDFVNRVAHAKAIDETERGFFRRYTTQISLQTRGNGAPDFQTLVSANAQSFQTMNRQASQFNQMVGGLIAIDLAHQYLGHYGKHSAEFPTQAAFPMPVNELITEQEWRTAVLRGAQNALACGLGVEGLKTVFECFDHMPSRPAWATYFIHPKANVTKINAELGKLERDFFVMNGDMQKGGFGKSR